MGTVTAVVCWLAIERAGLRTTVPGQGSMRVPKQQLDEALYLRVACIKKNVLAMAATWNVVRVLAAWLVLATP